MSVHSFGESFGLEAAFGGVSEYRAPKVVARVNDRSVKVAKIRGQFVWCDPVEPV